MGARAPQWEMALFGFGILSVGTTGKAGTWSQKLHPKPIPYSCVTLNKLSELSGLLFPPGFFFLQGFFFFLNLASFGVRGSLGLRFLDPCPTLVRAAPLGLFYMLWEQVDLPGRKHYTALYHYTASESHWTKCCPHALSVLTSLKSMDTYFHRSVESK